MPMHPVNADDLTKKLFEIHGHQLLIDGFFNGDPHPGNIMLLRDGRLGLIDYGQVKELTEFQRYEIAKFYVAMAQGDKEAIVDCIYSLGFKTEKMDREVAYETAVIAFDRDDKNILGGLGFQVKLEQLNARDPSKNVPEHYIMAGRMCIILKGVSNLLKQPPISLSEVWKDIALKAVQEYEDKHMMKS